LGIAVRRAGFAFTGAQRTPLTGEADGSGARFSQEGQLGLIPGKHFSPERLIELIVPTVKARIERGDAFKRDFIPSAGSKTEK